MTGRRGHYVMAGAGGPVAFALAHEIAHHDLGHLRHAEAWAASAAAHAPVKLATFLLQNLVQRIYSREMEFAADARALAHCRMAGYAPRECIEAFDILAWYLLDHRNLDAVYGTDNELELDADQAPNPLYRAYIESRLWWLRHRRSHPAISERRAALLSEIAWWESPDKTAPSSGVAPNESASATQRFA